MAVDKLATLSQVFSGSFVSFSHFALAEDVEMLSTFGLATTLVRGMGLLADDCQCSIDAVIPIHMGPITTPILPETTSVINLQFRNRKKAHDCYVDRRITVPDVTKPVISIIFEFGMEGQGSNAVEMGENDCHHEGQERGEDRHCLIVAWGCSPAVFGAILPGTEEQYKVILGGGTFLDEFPRKHEVENVRTLLDIKPVFSGARQEEQYAKRIPNE
ncbi:hypothetical protein FS749_013904 [Ceratobasidium sp. UAMH 11750]|nr:hypothetical protein FS749_013904 [Ceratobasidium sp. UAMH 11750]